MLNGGDETARENKSRVIRHQIKVSETDTEPPSHKGCFFWTWKEWLRYRSSERSKIQMAEKIRECQVEPNQKHKGPSNPTKIHMLLPGRFLLYLNDLISLEALWSGQQSTLHVNWRLYFPVNQGDNKKSKLVVN